MRIGEVAAAAGLATQTIRFYERRGLLPEPCRGPNGYRHYDGSMLVRLRFIRTAQTAGLTLVEIASISPSATTEPLPVATSSPCC